MGKKGFVAVAVALIVIVVLILAGSIWYYGTRQAKIIPSSVAQTEGCTVIPYTGAVSLSSLNTASTSVTFPGEADVRSGMVCAFVISPKLPPFTFRFTGDKENNILTTIQITEGTSTKIIQTIAKSSDNANNLEYNGIDPLAIDAVADPGVTNPNEGITAQEAIGTVESAVTTTDANFDGYGDLSILDNCGATGNCSYNFYLYNPTTNRFVYNSLLSGLGSPSFDESKKQIISSWNTSVADYEIDTYQYEDGTYVLIEKEISTWNRNDTGTDPNGTVTLQDFTLQNGAMKLVTSTTTPFDGTN